MSHWPQSFHLQKYPVGPDFQFLSAEVAKSRDIYPGSLDCLSYSLTLILLSFPRTD